jgi:hypothetical protein
MRIEMETLEIAHFVEQDGRSLPDENVERAKGYCDAKNASCCGK